MRLVIRRYCVASLPFQRTLRRAWIHVGRSCSGLASHPSRVPNWKRACGGGSCPCQRIAPNRTCATRVTHLLALEQSSTDPGSPRAKPAVLILRQSLDSPERYGAARRFDTIPSSFNRSAEASSLAPSGKVATSCRQSTLDRRTSVASRSLRWMSGSGPDRRHPGAGGRRRTR